MRRIIVTVLALALMATVVGLHGASPVAAKLPVTAGQVKTASAADSCTGWRSMIDPPAAIRVGRAGGTVETVDFRTYVGRVMAKEWNLNQPAVLETAAVAVKQYTWYYALAGNWRKSYVNAAGECFDVKDSTADQIYRHGVTVPDRIWAAVDATWGLSVRKSNRFFLTGYRAGTTSICGADATGHRLFAKSVIACAKDGLTREQIQLIYYAPDLTFHWSDTVAGGAPPAVDVAFDGPTLTLLDGAHVNQSNARVAWDSTAARPAGTAFQVQRVVAGVWKDVALSDPTQTSLELYIKPNVVHGFRVRLIDEVGNYGSWFSTGRFKPRLAQDKNTSGVLAWSPGWTAAKVAKASGGTVRRSNVAGSSVSLSFSGRAVGLLLARGPSQGLARIYVDEVLEAELDLYAPTNQWRRLVFTRHWDGSAAHTIRVEVGAIDGRTQVQFDAALVHP